MAGDPPRRLEAPRWSVRIRILASILVVTAVGMAVAGVTTYLVQRDRVLAGIDDRLIAHVESARVVLTGESDAAAGDLTQVAVPAAAATTTAEAVRAVLSRVIPGANESSVGLVDGTPTYIPGVAIDFHLEDDRAFLDRVVAETADGTVRMGTAVSPLGQLRYVAAPISVDGDPQQGLYVTAIDVDEQLSELTSSFLAYPLVAATSLLAVALVGWFVAGRLLRPIRELRAAASRISARQLDERIPVVGHDDVSDLTSTVNSMLDRIDAEVQGQRRLLDDVRHELKTPVTIVRGHLELLDPSDAADVAATRSLALEELDRMTALIDGIESLADTSAPALAVEVTDVASLTRDVFRKASVVADHEWTLAEVAEAEVPLDPDRITQAWLQLVDNAAKYSRPGTAIDLGSTLRGNEVELWVLDSGPGVPEGAEERIFERFGRAHQGRGVSGSGLGLSIVKAIATGHGGRVSLASSPRGSRFAIVLPRTTGTPEGTP